MKIASLNMTTFFTVAWLFSICPALPDDALARETGANYPSFRGARGGGLSSFTAVPHAWDEVSGTRILWKTKPPLPGWSSPVVWEGKVIVTGADQASRAVFCYDLATGDMLWSTAIPFVVGATEDYITDTMDTNWDRIMYAAATPAVNGRQVFAAFSNGQLVGLNLEDGHILWNRGIVKTSENTFGWSNSLLLFKNSVIAVAQGDEAFIARYDASTGRQLWRTPRKTPSWSSPILIDLDDGTQRVILPSDPDVTAWDPESGRQLWTTPVLTGGPEYCVGPSPVYGGKYVYVNSENCGIYAVDPRQGNIVWSVEELPSRAGFPDGTSMVTDGRYVYQYFDYFLTCLDAETGALVKEVELDEPASYASPALNNGWLYLFGDGVVTVVNPDPQTNFAVAGTGIVRDLTDSSPAFAEGRIIIRGEESLYCIGEK